MAGKNSIVKVEDNIYYIDPLKLGSHSVSGVYILIGDGVTLIEASTSHMAPHIFEAVRKLGFKEEDIKRCVVTHVHLDHAGAAGWLAQHVPNIKVYVHERGAKHLADPSRLVESAQMVYGSIDTILEIHGKIFPVPEGNLVPVKDMELLIGGEPPLSIFAAPGHAPHHLCIYEPKTGCLFSGEALGHYLPEFDLLTPAVAPPGFDFDALMQTYEKIRGLTSQTICFSQFGQHRDPTFVIKESERLVRSYAALVREALENGMGTGEIIDIMLRHLLQEPQARKFSEQSLRGMLMSIVLGYYHYFQRAGLVT